MFSANKFLKVKHLNKFGDIQGFTLIELLIVISIIGILTAITLVSFRGIQERARDAKRKADINRIHEALEQYYIDYGKYPSGDTWSGGTLRDVLGVLVEQNYIKEIPEDPTYNDGDYHRKYSYDHSQCGEATGDETYRLWAWLENENDPDVSDHCGIRGGARLIETENGEKYGVYMVTP